MQGDLLNKQCIAPLVFDDSPLRRRGWDKLQWPVTDESVFREQLVSLASHLGAAVPSRGGANNIDRLQPTTAFAPTRRSLSNIHADGAFPLHADTAHWITPCRYAVLACLDPGSGDRSTALLDVHSLTLTAEERLLLHSTPLRVANSRQSFFSTILSKTRQYVRFDRGCMSPVTSDGHRALAVFAERRWDKSIEQVQWQAGQVLIIDNWRCLHGRGAASRPDGERSLLRVLVT